MSDPERAKLLAHAGKEKIALIEDDAYADLRFDSAAGTPLVALDPRRVWHVGTLSKTVSPGLRVGWLVPPRRFRKDAIESKRAADLQSNSLAQALLEDFHDLNAIPAGPLLLQDLGLDEGKFVSPRGHRHKLERTLELIATYPRLKFVLCGDTGQADAQLYAEAVLAHPDRIAAVYLRDVDPDRVSSYDLLADERLAAAKDTGVPMLRVRDSMAIAGHAASIGLLAAADIETVRREVERDHARPSQAQAAVAGAIEGDTGQSGKTGTPAQQRPAP